MADEPRWKGREPLAFDGITEAKKTKTPQASDEPLPKRRSPAPARDAPIQGRLRTRKPEQQQEKPKTTQPKAPNSGKPARNGTAKKAVSAAHPPPPMKIKLRLTVSGVLPSNRTARPSKNCGGKTAVVTVASQKARRLISDEERAQCLLAMAQIRAMEKAQGGEEETDEDAEE